MFFRVLTKYVCGIDLHARSLTAVVMDLSGKILSKATLACGSTAICEFLAPFGNDITVGVESTYNWYWLVDLMEEYEIPCVLGHALYISRSMRRKHKSDPLDAHGIAELLRTNMFPLAYSYPAQMRSTRDLMRLRNSFVRRRAGTLTRFQCVLHQEGNTESLKNRLQYKSTRDGLIELGKTEGSREILSVNMEYIKGLDALIEGLEKSILAKANVHNPKHLDALQTIPGCGDITSLTVLYEIGEIERFKSPQQFCSYSRVVRAENSSGGKDLAGGGSNDKIGNPDLKWAISEIAAAMLRVSSVVNAWWIDVSKECGKKGAHSRLRHKVALAIYSMLRHDKVFDLEKFVGKKYMGRVKEKRETPGNPEAKPTSTAPETPSTPTLIETQESPAASVTGSSTEPKKRGRPALPRDAEGKIVRVVSHSQESGTASATHEGKETSGPTSKPSLTTAPPSQQITEDPGQESRSRRGRPPLPRDSQGNVIRQAAAQSEQSPPTVASVPNTERAAGTMQQNLAQNLSRISADDLKTLHRLSG